MPQGPDHDPARKQNHQDQTWDESGEKDSDDRRIGRNGIDDHRDRGGDENAQSARSGERAERHPFIVAAPHQFGQSNLGDRGAGGCR